MNWVKGMALALGVAFVSLSFGSVSADAGCRGCKGKIVKKSRSVRHSSSRPVRYKVRRTKSYRNRYVRHVHTRVRVRHVRPVVRVRHVHTVYTRRVVYHQTRTVNRVVRHAPRYVSSRQVRHVQLGTRHVTCGCR